MTVNELCRDETLIVFQIILGCSAMFTQGRIQEGAKIGQRGAQSQKDFFFRLDGYNSKPNA